MFNGNVAVFRVVVMKPWSGPGSVSRGAVEAVPGSVVVSMIEIAAILLAATEQLLSNNVCQTLVVSGPNSDSKLQQDTGGC